MGLIGGVCVLILYLWLLARAAMIARRCRRVLPALLIIGMASMVAFQALFHMAINVGVFPVSGQPLPLISKGGTSIIVTSVAFAIMLSISRTIANQNSKNNKTEEAQLPDDLRAENPTQMISGNEMNFLVSGGGTGGHIFPALSIANEIKRRYPQAHILFVGAQGRMEMERVPAAGYPIKGLPVMGFDRKHLLRNVKVLYRVWKCTRMAKDIIKEFKPNVAIGVGGYASGPTLKEAQKMGVPTLLQEQNSYAGVTNKLLAKGAQCICVAYSGMERFFPAGKIVMTGNPVRRNLLECTATPQQARQELGLDPDKKTILVIGGSLGARTVNESIIAGLQAIAGHDDVQVLWQSGKY